MIAKHFGLAGLIGCVLWASPVCGRAATEIVGEETAMMEPVVVTASRLTSPLSQVGSSVTIITNEDLKAGGFTSLDEALELVHGLDVVQSGGPGQLTETYIRGANSGRTLIMVNGVELNDAIEPGRAVNLAHVTLDNVEKIEILRGPQSAVYGSGAMGGVINVITKKGTKKWEAGLDLMGGKYSTWNALASVTGSLSDTADVSLATSWNYSKGFSAAKRNRTYDEPQPDMLPNGYRNWTVDLGLGYALTPDWSARGSYRSTQGITELDYGGGDYADAEDYTVASNRQVARLETGGRVSEIWRQTASVGLSQIDRSYRKVLTPSSAARVSDYHGRNILADWSHQLDFPALWSSLAAGVSYRQEQGRYDEPQYADYFEERSEHQFGTYLQERFQQWGFTLDACGRWDAHGQFGNQLTYRLAPVYSFAATGTSLKGTWGTGFNAPSLYQLFSSYGNQNLSPEESVGWDVGVEQKLSRNFKLGATYFHNDFKNQIDFVMDPVTYEGRYQNLSKVQTKGWEAFFVGTPIPDLTIKLDYTKLTANDLTDEAVTGPVPLRRRADYQLGLDAGYRWGGISAQFGVKRVGPRWDVKYDSVTYEQRQVVLEPYTLANLCITYAPTRTLELQLKIENLLNADYEEAVGYATPGFGVYSGMKLALK